LPLHGHCMVGHTSELGRTWHGCIWHTCCGSGGAPASPPAPHARTRTTTCHHHPSFLIRASGGMPGRGLRGICCTTLRAACCAARLGLHCLQPSSPPISEQTTFPLPPSLPPAGTPTPSTLGTNRRINRRMPCDDGHRETRQGGRRAWKGTQAWGPAAHAYHVSQRSIHCGSSTNAPAHAPHTMPRTNADMFDGGLDIAAQRQPVAGSACARYLITAPCWCRWRYMR